MARDGNSLPRDIKKQHTTHRGAGSGYNEGGAQEARLTVRVSVLVCSEAAPQSILGRETTCVRALGEPVRA